MAKSKPNIPAVTRAAGLAGRAIARLEDAAAKTLAETVGKDGRSLRLVSQTGGLQALIKSGNVTIQIEGDAFAVDMGGEDT
jgi:hypothetical protein